MYGSDQSKEADVLFMVLPISYIGTHLVQEAFLAVVTDCADRGDENVRLVAHLNHKGAAGLGSLVARGPNFLVH